MESCAYLLYSLAFGDIFIAHLDPGVAEGFEQVSRVQTLEIGCLVSNCRDTNQVPNMTYCAPRISQGQTD